MNTHPARAAGHALLAVVLVLRWRRHPVAPVPGRRRAWGTALGFGAPATVVGLTVARTQPRWTSPVPASGVPGLLITLGSSAAVEELLWRAPLRRPASPLRKVLLSCTSAGGFVGLHLRRDGRDALPVHTVLTAGWTLGHLLGAPVRSLVLAHGLYNLVAVGLHDHAARDDD